uniref:Chitin-binding type-2 domain-containing protein n=1 Tax=Cacopsylla melanoneura TaxID=428564 RepID=A0A8D9EWZ6_9HEMI
MLDHRIPSVPCIIFGIIILCQLPNLQTERVQKSKAKLNDVVPNRRIVPLSSNDLLAAQLLNETFPTYDAKIKRKVRKLENDGQGETAALDAVKTEEYQGVAGRPGIDFPILSNIPVTSFNCRNIKSPGYYADLETNCQVFHICEGGQKISFLCPNGTIFRQSNLICDWWFRVDCGESQNLYEESAEQLAIDQKGYKSKAKPSEKSANLESDSQANYRAAAPERTTAPSNSFYNTHESYTGTSRTKASGNQPLRQNTFSSPGNQYQRNYNNINNNNEVNQVQQAPQLVTPSPNTFFSNHRYQDPTEFNPNDDIAFDNFSGRSFTLENKRISPKPKAPVQEVIPQDNNNYSGGNSLDGESQVLAESVNYGTGKQNRYQQINHLKQDVAVVDNFKQELGRKQFDSLKLSTLNPQTGNNIPQSSPVQQANSFLQSSTIAKDASFPQSTTIQQSPVFAQGSTVQQNGEFRQIPNGQQSTTLQQSTNVPQSTTFQQGTTNQETTNYPQSTTIQQGSTYSQISTIQNTDYPQSTTYQDSTTYQQAVTNPLTTTYQQTVGDLQSTTYQQGITNPLTTNYQQTGGDTQTTLQQGTTAGLTQTANTANNAPTSNVRYTTPFVQESSTPVYSTIKESTFGYSTIKDASFPTTFSGSTASPEFLSTANFNRISLNQQSNLVPEANYNAGEENTNAIDSISLYYDQINNKESVRLPVSSYDTKNKISVSDIFLNSKVPSTSYDLSNSLPSVLTDSTKEGYSFLFSNGSSDPFYSRDNTQTVSKSPVYESLVPQQNQGIVQGIASTSQYTTSPPPPPTTPPSPPLPFSHSFFVLLLFFSL